MKKTIRPTAPAFCINYGLLFLSFTSIFLTLLQSPIYPINTLVAIVAVWIFSIEVKDTYLILDDHTLTLSRRFRHQNNKVKIRKEVVNLHDIEQVAYGREINKSRYELTYSGRHSGYTPDEILFKVGKKYIPIDAKPYSKKNLRTLISALHTLPSIEIHGSLNDYIA